MENYGGREVCIQDGGGDTCCLRSSREGTDAQGRVIDHADCMLLGRWLRRLRLSLMYEYKKCILARDDLAT